MLSQSPSPSATHPSGVAEPSHADEHITRRLREAALVDIRVLDRLIVAVSGRHILSMAEKGALMSPFGYASKSEAKYRHLAAGQGDPLNSMQVGFLPKNLGATIATDREPLDYINRYDYYDHSDYDDGGDMRREASAMMVRQNLGELLNHVQYRGDSVVVTKDGKPVAALVDYPLYERIRQLRESFDQLTERLGRIYEQVPDKVAHTEIDEAVSQVRRARRRR